MARKPRSKSTATPRATVAPRTKALEITRLPLPADWRTSTWQVPPMLAKIRPEDYERTAREFEADARGKVSDDWREAWKVWCRRILIEGGKRLTPEPVGLFD